MSVRDRDEIAPETRLLLIALFEGMAEGVRNGTFRFSEEQATRLVAAIKGMRDADKNDGRLRICTISTACDYLGISQPTFRKYVKQGLIAPGGKVKGLTELVWDKAEIERFAEERGRK
ncbi:MAG: helix-turn-helix domain-containing protein [Bacteroidales bacterium]|nr:helix-turn-helix domain-containing protein [Bacteroidales bacterium]